jgi:excinuclease ABC subunit A
MINKIVIKGAKENNLKDVNIEIPKDKLVIITGVSGSGKSSLAFDTIYEEGKRRYMESLSSYARMFLGGNEKPNVESIDGLSPSISIDQKTTSHNPRSTVGTVTEIYDYLRVLYARIGTPYCPHGHGKIESLTIKEIQDKIINSCKNGDKLQVLSPIVNREKGTFKNELEKLKREGFLRVRADGNIYSLDDTITLEKNKVHSIAIVIDRIVFNKDKETTSRINEALEIALKHGEEKVITLVNDKEEFYTKTHACKVCGFNIPELEPRLFSFNSPTGACDYCKGLGFTYEPDEEKMVPDPDLSINDGGIE